MTWCMVHGGGEDGSSPSISRLNRSRMAFESPIVEQW